jgi:hypothetical protein
VTAARHRSAWLLSLGVAAAGALAAHGTAYRIAEPHDERREHLLEQTGHGYVDPALAASLCAALVIVGFAGRMLAGAHRGDRPPLWLFALAPPVGFTLQEHAERMLHDGTFLVSLGPAFFVGLLLQLPFALVALFAARALLAAAGALARRLGSPPRLKPAHHARFALAGASSLPCAPPLVGARGQRAPPPGLAGCR